MLLCCELQFNGTARRNWARCLLSARPAEPTAGHRSSFAILSPVMPGGKRTVAMKDAGGGGRATIAAVFASIVRRLRSLGAGAWPFLHRQPSKIDSAAPNTPHTHVSPPDLPGCVPSRSPIPLDVPPG